MISKQKWVIALLGILCFGAGVLAARSLPLNVRETEEVPTTEELLTSKSDEERAIIIAELMRHRWTATVPLTNALGPYDEFTTDPGPQLAVLDAIIADPLSLEALLHSVALASIGDRSSEEQRRKATAAYAVLWGTISNTRETMLVSALKESNTKLREAKALVVAMIFGWSEHDARATLQQKGAAVLLKSIQNRSGKRDITDFHEHGQNPDDRRLDKPALRNQ